MVENILYTDVVLHDVLWTPQDGEKTGWSILPVYGNISCGNFKLIDDNAEGYLEIFSRRWGDCGSFER